MTDCNVLEGYIDRAELARQLGKCVRTLDRWYELREGPAATMVGNRRLYHINDVRDWLRSQRVEMPARRVG